MTIEMYSYRICLLVFFLFSSGCLQTSIGQVTAKKQSLNELWDFDLPDKDESKITLVVKYLFVPQIVIDVNKVRQYISDERFARFRNEYGDINAVNAIFRKSVKECDYNLKIALVSCLFAVLDHQYVKLKTPLRGTVNMPLTFETDSSFLMRINHLPEKLYYDSPNTAVGDRDKLQHFFASAYLAYLTDSPKLVETIGNLIEWLEQRLVVGGLDDWRDKRANRQGAIFGSTLLYNKTSIPSDFLKYEQQEELNENDTCCR